MPYCATASLQTDWQANVSKKTKDNLLAKPVNDVLMASYKAGLAEGRLAAIEESMDSVAELIFKAEDLMVGLGDNPEGTIRANAEHTLRALNLAFAAVTGSASGSAAFLDLLTQSRQRLLKKTGVMH